MKPTAIIDPVDFFKNPQSPAQKRYEALRSYYLDESLSQAEAAEKAGYALSTFQSLVSDFRNGKIRFFLKPQYGPKKRRVSDYVTNKIITLRKSNHSIYDIRDILKSEGIKKSLQTIDRILKDEGFEKLPRRTDKERGLSKKKTILPPKVSMINFDELDGYRFECQVGGIYYFIPYILNSELYDLVSRSSFPETSSLSKVNSVFTILSLKLMGHERLSKISSYNHDTGLGFFAGLNVPPKTTATSTYSYLIDKDSITSFMEDFISQMISNYPQYYEGKTVNLDFHSIPHYGEKSSMDKNWVGSKHQSMKSALTFFAQDGESRMLIYENTDIDRKEASAEIKNFVDHWLRIRGVIDQTLVFDSKLTTYDKLEELDEDGVKFITLRRKGKNLIKDANMRPEKEWVEVDLKKAKRKHNKFKMYRKDITLPRTKLGVRQVIFKDHGRSSPTFLITNNFGIELEDLALHYSNRWLIENKFSEIVDFFNLNSLSSPFMIRIYFDVAMTLVADTLYRLLAKDLKRFENCTPKTLFSDFINCRCKGEVVGDEVIIRMKKKATTPLFKSNEVFKRSRSVPWFGNKKIRYEWIS